MGAIAERFLISGHEEQELLPEGGNIDKERFNLTVIGKADSRRSFRAQISE